VPNGGIISIFLGFDVKMTAVFNGQNSSQLCCGVQLMQARWFVLFRLMEKPRRSSQAGKGVV